MPYDEPRPVDTVELLEQKAAAVRKHAYGDVALYATVSKVPNLADVEKLAKAGACAFKISSFEAHPTRFPRIANDHTLDLLEALAATDLPVGLHNEDQEIVRSRVARFEAAGRTAPLDHDPSRPAVAEDAATAVFLELGVASGAHVHIVHISTPRGFELVRRYKSEGFRATGEMCVHYLHFDASEAMPRLGPLLKVNPPIRSGVRDRLWGELAAGGADFVSSDHSAWPLDRKNTGSILSAAAGIPGLETLLPAFYSGLMARGYDAPSSAALYLSERPARFFGLWPQKGGLMPGADADIVVLDPKPWIFRAAEARDGSGWSPFDGETFTGRPVATYVRGRLVWDGRNIVGEPGHGRFVARRAVSKAKTAVA